MIRNGSILLILILCFTSKAQDLPHASWAKAGVNKAEAISKLPDFASIKDVKTKKRSFFDLIRPMVKEENQILQNENEQIVALFSEIEDGQELNETDKEWLEDMAAYYRVSPFDMTESADIQALLKKVDIIPESLFLAQAAIESAWGTSRFAKTANNLFGQWCFTQGCGIVPSKRKPDQTHEVQKFETINASVKSYMHHLNSHPFYEPLRDARLASRKAKTAPSGYEMAVGLEKYSARGLEYVKEVRSVIRYNKLEVNK